MEKTNKGLVEYAKKALAEKWGYVWGTFGTLLTEEKLQKKIQQYPEMVGANQSFIRRNWLGRKTSDCVGLIKSYIWFDGSDVSYDGKYDVSADGMYQRAKEKGTMPTMPDTPGICMWKPGHIGVYIGDGWVIEAHNTFKGIIKTPLKGKGATPWTHWLECPFIDYLDQPDPMPGHVQANPTHAVEISALCKQLGVKDVTQLPTLKQGSQGKAVEYVQKRLGAKVDGIYGPMTEAVVRAFQTRCSFRGAAVDGIVGQKTWAELNK